MRLGFLRGPLSYHCGQKYSIRLNFDVSNERGLHFRPERYEKQPVCRNTYHQKKIRKKVPPSTLVINSSTPRRYKNKATWSMEAKGKQRQFPGRAGKLVLQNATKKANKSGNILPGVKWQKKKNPSDYKTNGKTEEEKQT